MRAEELRNRKKEDRRALKQEKGEQKGSEIGKRGKKGL